SGLRGLHVNGFLYSFDLKTGEQNWFNIADNQMILLDEFERIPVVLMTARYNKWLDQFRGSQVYMVAMRSYDKKTGKLLWNQEDQTNSRQQFHPLKVDARNGRVDLLSYNLRWSHFLEGTDGKGGGAPGGPGDMRSSTGPAPLPPGVGFL